MIAEGKAERRAIETGRTWEGGALIEVTIGLAPGDLVVIEPLPELEPGDTVRLLSE